MNAALVVELPGDVSDAFQRAGCAPHQYNGNGVTLAKCPACRTNDAVEIRAAACRHGTTIACASGCDATAIAVELKLTQATGFSKSTSTEAPKAGTQSATSGRAPRSWADMTVRLTVEQLRETPPPRQYLIWDAEGRGVMPRGRVAMLGAPGGTGKSKAVIALALAVATGGRWFGSWPCEQGRVLLVLAEEDQPEAMRRLHYALRMSGDTELEAVVSNLSVVPAAGEGLALTYEADAATGGLPETARAAELRKTLRDAMAEGRPYALVVLDPSSRFAGADVEKDNAAATRYVQVLETLTAPECGGPNVLLPAHTRKRAQHDEPGSTDALRGSSGQRDGARWVAMLERRKLVDGAPKLLDFTISKTNYGAENAIVLAAQEDMEGALRAATEDEIERWTAAAGGKTQAARDERSVDVQARVLALLAAQGPKSGRKVAEAIGVRPDTVNAACLALKGAGRVTRRGGRMGAWEVIPGDSQVAPGDTGDTVNGASALKGAGSGKHQFTHQGGASPESPHPFGCRCGGDVCAVVAVPADAEEPGVADA